MTYANTLGQLGQQTALVVPAGSLVRATGRLTAGAISQQQLDQMIQVSFASLMGKMGLSFVGARKEGTLRARRVVVEARLAQNMSSGQLTGAFTRLFTAATGAVGGTAAWSVTVSHPGLVRRQIGVPGPLPPGFPPTDARRYQIPAAPGPGIPTWVWAVSAVAVLGVIAVVALSRPKRVAAPAAPAPVAANRRRRGRRRR